MYLVKRYFRGETFRHGEEFDASKPGKEAPDAIVVDAQPPHPDAEYKFADWVSNGAWITWMIPTEDPVELDLG